MDMTTMNRMVNGLTAGGEFTRAQAERLVRAVDVAVSVFRRLQGLSHGHLPVVGTFLFRSALTISGSRRLAISSLSVLSDRHTSLPLRLMRA